jgi:hypothetical protein
MEICEFERRVIMNIHTLSEYKGAATGAASADASDEARMEQIRELLHGELKREHEARISVLEARIRELETGIFNQLDALHARVEALSADMLNVRREQLDELARGFVDMGERVRRLTVRD